MSEALTEKRWGGGGLLLLILLGVLLAAPLLRHRSMDHPLKASRGTDLCPLLPPPPPSLRHLRAAPMPGGGAALSVTCQYTDGQKQPMLTVALSSARQLSQGGPADTEKMFEIWMKEVRATYGSGSALSGEWRHGGTWQHVGRQSLIFEDGGVIVVLESMQLDAAALAAHARLVQQALREAKVD